MSKLSGKEVHNHYFNSSHDQDIQFPQLFEAVAEGNMHCYCLLQLEDNASENQDFLVRYANDKLIKLLRAPRSSVLGNYLSKVYPFSENWIQCARYFDSLRLGRPILEEFPLQVFERTRWYRHEIVPLSEELLSVTAEDITDRKLLEKELVRGAYFDDLTGLKNRNALLQFLKSTKEQSGWLTLVLFDIENFRSINRCFGVKTANRLLIELARALQCLDEGVAYRIFADTFALVVVRATNEVRLGEVTITKWLNRLSGNYDFESRSVPCQLRAGYSSTHSADPDKISALPDEAEIALSEAKKQQSNSIVQYSGAVAQSHQLRRSIGKYLPEALASRAFFPNFQPQYDLANGQVIGLEALCRWSHVELGDVSPDVFILIAEQMNLLQILDLQLLIEVVDNISRLPVQKSQLGISVNSSPLSIQDSAYVDRLVEISKELPDWCVLEVELTENAFISDDQSLQQSMLRLQKQGVSIALDDFGSGYSNLSYLAYLPFEKLKLDRGLISGLENNSRNADLISGAIDLAHRLGLKVVAEGIENDYQLSWLRTAGCDIGQGYLLSKPLPQSEHRRFFKSLESCI